MKFIVFILVVAACVWGYFNLDFNAIKSNTVQGVKNEKTIFGVTNAREQNRAETQDVLNNNF